MAQIKLNVAVGWLKVRFSLVTVTESNPLRGGMDVAGEYVPQSAAGIAKTDPGILAPQLRATLLFIATEQGREVQSGTQQINFPEVDFTLGRWRWQCCRYAPLIDFQNITQAGCPKLRIDTRLGLAS